MDVLPEVGSILRVTAARAGFRRAGCAWPAEPREVAIAALSEDELAQLRAEPMLIVEEIALLTAAPQPGPGQGEGGAGVTEGGPPASRANSAGAAAPDPGSAAGAGKVHPQRAGGGSQGSASRDAEPAATGHEGDKDTPPEREPMAGGGDAPLGAGPAAGRRPPKGPGSKSGAGKAKG